MDSEALRRLSGASGGVKELMAVTLVFGLANVAGEAVPIL